MKDKEIKTKKQAMERIDEIAEECKYDNWDEMGAKAVSSKTIQNTKTIIELLSNTNKG